MFPDSKIAEKQTINRKKIKLIIENVLLKTINSIIINRMRNKFSISIDSSRDISNKNELIIAVRYFDPEKFQIRDVIYEIIEMNQTKSNKIFESTKKLLKEDNITLFISHIINDR